MEDADHLLFKCPMAEFMWAFVREALGWNGYPRSMRELLSDWLPVKFGTSFQTGFTCFAGLAWALWTTRNKISIQKMFPEKSIIVVYNALSYIQKWRVQMKPLEKNSAMELTKRVMDNAKESVPNSVNLSDVGVIHDASHSSIRSSPVAAMGKNYPAWAPSIRRPSRRPGRSSAPSSPRRAVPRSCSASCKTLLPPAYLRSDI
jgi:hypothetical protein